MDKYEEQALSDIEKYGCHIIHVLEEGQAPGFSYSIGIEQKTGQPEIIVTGLKQELTHFLINDYNSRVKSGEIFKPDKKYQDFLEGFDVIFKPVNRRHYADYFGWANWLYSGNNFRVMQLIYPSTSGIWPWEPEAPADLIHCIPKLYEN